MSMSVRCLSVDLEWMEAAFKNLNLNARDQVYV